MVMNEPFTGFIPPRNLDVSDEQKVETQDESEVDVRYTIEQLIKVVGGFEPTKEVVSPGRGIKLEGKVKGDVLDLAGVFAGTKPAAVVSLGWDGETARLIEEFRNAAPRYNLAVEVCSDNGSSGTGSLIISRDPEVAQRIREMFTLRSARAGLIDPEAFDTELGRLLGYPEDAIKEYTNKMEDFGNYDLIRHEESSKGELK